MSLNLITKENRKPREYTEKQQKFLDVLSETFDVSKAFKAAGYAGTTQTRVVEALREEILERTQNYLASHAPRAAKQIVGTLEGTVQKESDYYSSQYKAAMEVLDRVGIGKQTHVDVSGEIQHAVILLPAKKEPKVIDHE